MKKGEKGNNKIQRHRSIPRIWSVSICDIHIELMILYDISYNISPLKVANGYRNIEMCARSIFSSAATARVKTPIIIQHSGGEQRVLGKLDEEKRAGHKIRQFISNLFWLYQVHTTAPACRMNQDNMRKCLSALNTQPENRQQFACRFCRLSSALSYPTINFNSTL